VTHWVDGTHRRAGPALIAVGGTSGEDRRPTLSLASFNVHMAMDGWGRRYDVAGECRALDADVLVMQESWTPDDGGPSTAQMVAGQLGYQVVAEVGLARGKRFGPLASDSGRWAPWPGNVRKAFRLDDETWRSRNGPRERPFERGGWGVAMLARVPVRDTEVIHLGQLRRDPARRAVIATTADLGGREVSLFGTHMSHITHGSHAQYRRLGTLLPHPDHAAVLAGDMNLWGPPVNSFFPAWRRAVIARTWPAHRPHSQLDHILITPPLSVVHARAATRSGSDHRPVVVTLALA
jgi:endonuclease/exonuclease/phosphatase family metal-dependent hydrolase